MTAVDVRSWTKKNIWTLASGELATRPGFRRIYEPPDNREYVGGFSVKIPQTDDVVHYAFDVSVASPKDLTLRILDEDFQEFQVFDLGTDVVPSVITPCVVVGQMLITSPDMPTLFGIVGSSVAFAVKPVDELPTGIATIDVPRGVCTNVCNIPVVGSGASLHWGEPMSPFATNFQGGDIRVFTGKNTDQRPGVIYGVHEGAGGSLVVPTSEGCYGLDSSAAAVAFVGANGTAWRMLNHNKAMSYASSCVIRGRVYGLTMYGYTLVDTETDGEMMLSDPVQPRAFGPRMTLPDFRRGRMMATDEGPLVSSDTLNACHRYDVGEKVGGWWDLPELGNDFEVVGVLSEQDGNQLLIDSSGIWAMSGNCDGEISLESEYSEQPKGACFGVIPTSPDLNRLVEFISVGAANGGGDAEVHAAIRGKAYGEPVLVDVDGFTVGDDTWTADKRLTTTPVDAARFRFGVDDCPPTRDVGVEAAFDGANVRISPFVTVEYSESAPRRPAKVG